MCMCMCQGTIPSVRAWLLNDTTDTAIAIERLPLSCIFKKTDINESQNLTKTFAIHLCRASFRMVTFTFTKQSLYPFILLKH